MVALWQEPSLRVGDPKFVQMVHVDPEGQTMQISNIIFFSRSGSGTVKLL